MSQTSPNRRKSIAIPDHSARPSTRRRAQSMVPEILSPASRARLSRGPRKSILKMFPMKDTDDPDSMESSQNDSADARKALNRRVSFAETQVVRFFHKDKDRRRRSSRFGIESPQSDEHNSPAESAAPPQISNENQYPGVVRGRRSSIRQSLGEVSMEMDETQAIGLSTYVSKPPRLSDILNDDDEDYAEEGMSMELDDVMPSQTARRRSSSAPPGTRLPLSEVAIPGPDEEDFNRSTSFSDATSDYTGSDYSRSMEIVVPMGHVFNAPEENPAWLALRAATHSGDQPLTKATSDDDGEGEEDMELTHAVSRLQTARDSIGRFVQDDSFSSEDSSFADNPDRTTNLTDILRRESLGAEDFTMNTDQGSTMELTRPYLATHASEASSDAPEPPESTPPPESEPQTAPSKENDPPPPSRQTVFSAPFKPQPSVFSSSTSTATSSSTSAPKPPQTGGTTPFQFSFTPKPMRLPPSASPKKSSTPQRPSAAFAPPVAKPSPKKRSAPDDPPDGSTPSKKRSLAAISPSKGSSNAPGPDGSRTTGSTSSRRLSLRRPSGYLAQRKSIGAAPPSISGPRKLAGRASMAQPGTGDAWSRFDPHQPLPRNIFSPNKDQPLEGVESTKLGDQETLEEPTRIRLAPTEIFVYQDPEPSTAEVTSSQETEVIPEDEDVPTYTDDPPPEDEILPDADKQHGDPVEEEQPSISIQQFLEMTGIRFMDEIIVPRRSSIHHGQTRKPRRSSLSQDETPSAPLADYCIAMNVNAPQLELYTHVAHDLEAWIARSKAHYSQAEEEALRMTPELFREYATADEEGQAELLHQLKLIKAHAQATAKGEWYDWKLQWVEQLYESADKGFKDLEKDADTLQGLLEQSQTLLPPLREEYAQIMRELEEEQAFIASIEQDDQDYLNELKTSISEQGAEVQALRTELNDNQQKIEMLEMRISEWEVEKRENESIIMESQRIINHTKNSTISEVARKQAELQSLQSINGWRLTKIAPDTFEFILADRFRVFIPCVDFKPNAKRIEFSKCSNTLAARDLLPGFDTAVLRMAPHQLRQSNGNLTTTTQISQKIRDFWSSCSLIRRQLEMVNCKFRITINELPSGGGFTATFPMLYYDIKSKIMISFIFDRETMANWPLSIGSLQYKADVVYGTIDPQKVLQALQKRLREATPADSHACLWDACIEALECLS